MASLERKGKIYWVRFRHAGKSFKRSLKTSSSDDAKVGLAIVAQTLYRIRSGQLQLPTEVDFADFVISGGTLAAAKAGPVVPTIAGIIDEYLSYIEHKAAPSYLAAQKTHFKHFKLFLGRRMKIPVTEITADEIQMFLDTNLKKWDPNTVNKHRITLVQLFKYAVKQRRLIPHSPMLTIEKIPFGLDRPPFRTNDEIEAVICRGGLSDAEVLKLWECLYLSTTEIAELLELVRRRSSSATGPLLHAMAAYTGMRRGEILRLKWVDVDLEQRSITARSRKQSRTRREVTRQIDIHADLLVILRKWRDDHPRGQFLIGDNETLDELSPDQANYRFWQPLRGAKWCLDAKKHWYKIGFHTYRHSFASNLASARVDQRVIDEFMGHTTEDMRKRYRHLFPSLRRDAIDALCFRSTNHDA